MRATVFLDADLENTIWNNFQKINPLGMGEAKSIKLGKYLYVALVVARPVQQGERSADDMIDISYPADTLLAYDLELEYYLDSGLKNKARLKDLGLLSGKNSIVYSRNNVDSNSDSASINLPTFFVKGQKTPLNILYGSCRKLHGNGDDDLSTADVLIKSSLKNLAQRPCALYLTGDQIYADDVAITLSRYLVEYGSYLVGLEEYVECAGKKITEIHPKERDSLIRDHAKFTSDHRKNHLISFGEFAAMHLLAWNVDNWPESYPQNGYGFDIEKRAYRNEIAALDNARKKLPYIRRLFANIPTYMMFDDHEITDDWNITQEWYDAVRASSCGFQIVANGLAAFWAFQGWGNDPDLFQERFIEIVSRYLGNNDDVIDVATFRPAGAKNDNDNNNNNKNNIIDNNNNASFFAKSEVLDDDNINNNNINSNINNNSITNVLSQYLVVFDNTGTVVDKNVFRTTLWDFHNWTFTVPTDPLTVFLDCRTQRHFDSRSGPPQLLNENELSTLLQKARNANYKNGDPIILVSSTPVIGFDLAESLQESLARISGVYRWDLETWSANERGFVKFLSFLKENMDPSHLIFLSGDVHYGFTMGATFYLLKKPKTDPPLEMKMTQLNSSALKTTNIAKDFLFSKFLAGIRQMFFPKYTVRAGWIDMHSKSKILKLDNPNEYSGNKVRLAKPILSMKPDWIETRTILKLFTNVGISLRKKNYKLILSDNNIGLVTIDSGKTQINHKLLIQKKGKIFVYQTDVKMARPDKQS